MTFSISFPSVFKRTIDWKVFGELYNTLLGLGIIIEVDFLKCEG